MARTILLISLAAAVSMATPADAAKKHGPAKTEAPAVGRPAAPAPAAPGVFAEPVSTANYMVPNPVALRPMTPAEAQANAVWNLRAALNVAALQCQFSPFLATVATYNAFLRHHSAEIMGAQTAMMAHFKRYDGTRAQNSFDQYTTRTYNSFSTLDAQYSFCEAAGVVGRETLTLPKDRLGPMALRSYPVMRQALVPKPLSPALVFTGMEPVIVPDLAG